MTIGVPVVLGIRSASVVSFGVRSSQARPKRTTERKVFHLPKAPGMGTSVVFSSRNRRRLPHFLEPVCGLQEGTQDRVRTVLR